MRFKTLNGWISAFLFALFIVGSLYTVMPEGRTATVIPGTSLIMTSPTMTYATPSATIVTSSFPTTIVDTAATSITTAPSLPPFDFTLMLSPPIITVKQGETANYQLQIAYSDPSYYGTQINYQVTGLSPGLNWIPAGGGTIPISTSPTTPPGTYQVTVIGSAQGKTHQTSATLIVTESSPTTVDEEEKEPTSTIQSTPTTSVETITVTEPQTDEEGSDLASQLLNPTVLMIIIIAVLATALITTLMRKRK